MPLPVLSTSQRLTGSLVLIGLLLGACKKEEERPAPPTEDTSVTLRTRYFTCSSTIPSIWADVEPDPDRADYVVSCAVQMGKLTIAPGVRVQFVGAEAGLSVNELQCVGTADKPIVLEGRTHQAGAWKGIELRAPGFYAPTPILSRLAYVELRETGGQPHNREALSRAALLLNDNTRVSLDHVSVSNCQGQGVVASTKTYLSGRLEYCANSTFTGCQGYPLLLNTRSISAVQANCVLRDNGTDAVAFLDGFNYEAGPVTFHALRYLFLSSYLGAGFQQEPTVIEPGAELVFTRGMRFLTWLDQLTAVGTPDKPIIFRGQTSGPGNWIGVQVYSAAPNRMDYCLVQDAGLTDSVSMGTQGGVVVNRYYNTGLPAQLTITNSVLRNNLGWGIHAWQAAQLTESNNLFQNNAAGPIGRFN